MFLSNEQREAKRQRDEYIAQLEKELQQLKNDIDVRRRANQQALESYKQSIADKWEYLSVSDQNIDNWKSLDNLGSMGWELVGISTYAVGYEVKKVYTEYVFKRRMLRNVPDDINQASLETASMLIQLNELTTKIQQAKKN